MTNNIKTTVEELRKLINVDNVIGTSYKNGCRIRCRRKPSWK